MSLVATLRVCPAHDLDELHQDPERIIPYLVNEDPDAPPPPPPPGFWARLLGKRPPPWLPPLKIPDGTEDLELDKAWHAVHFILTESAEPTAHVLSFLMSGGLSLGGDDWDVGYGPARAFRPDDVKAIAEALGTLGDDPVAARYDAARMTQLEIYPGEWTSNDGEQQDWVRSSVRAVRELLARARSSNKALIVWVS